MTQPVRPGGPPVPQASKPPPVTSTPVISGDTIRSYTDTDLSPLPGLSLLHAVITACCG